MAVEWGRFIGRGMDVIVIGDEQVHAPLSVTQLQPVQEIHKVAADLVSGIHDLELLAGGSLQTGVDAGAVAAVFLVDDLDDVGILGGIAVADGTSIVLGAVVDDDDLHPLAAAEQGLDAFFHVVLRIITGHIKSKQFHIQ